MISILLASYNGKRFIAEQIESLLGQTVQDFRIFICDDRSTDGTFSIILDYADKYPDKIFAVQNGENSGGAKYNFIRMMIAHKDDYVMLCDQDDVWLPNKIEKSLRKMRDMEEAYGISVPLLVHSDLKVAGKDLEILSESFMKDMLADYHKNSLNTLLIQNILTGCTAMYNRALANLIHTAPAYMVMHDWWLILVAAAFGKIGAIYEPTILYRQHGNNDIGAKKVWSLGHVFHKLTHSWEMTDAINQTYKQTRSFLNMFSDKLSHEQKALLEAYASIPGQARAKRIRTVFKYGTFKTGFTRKTAQILLLLKERRVRI